MRKPFCVIPSVEAFSGYGSAFRNCCAADPQIDSEPGQSFESWWQDPRLQDFRARMHEQVWLPECHRCQLQEQQSGHSFRTAVNDQVTEVSDVWPSRWNLKFGNTCNLACWTCNEHASSVIAQHKRVIGILPTGFVDPEHHFQREWPELEAAVLKSYQHHDLVTITLVGGEPMYNKTVTRFLQGLLDQGLAPRTRLEFHTNGTHVNVRLFADRAWHYVCVFLSIDAVGHKAEWLRYGSRWADVEHNIEFFRTVANYVEVHCTLSVLNVNDLAALDEFCQQQQLPLKIHTVTDPAFMDLTRWPGDPATLADFARLNDRGLLGYYQLIGIDPDPKAAQELDKYIQQFDGLRQNLGDFDPVLQRAIKVSKH